MTGNVCTKPYEQDIPLNINEMNNVTKIKLKYEITSIHTFLKAWFSLKDNLLNAPNLIVDLYLSASPCPLNCCNAF